MPSIIELRKEFIRPVNNDTMNAVFFTCSVSQAATRSGKKYPAEWEAFLNVRVNNVLVRLHPVDRDKRLIKMEGKIKLLIETAEEFLVELRTRTVTPAKKKKVKRVWLNASGDTAFTGRCAYELDRWGSGQFQLGDCDRGIVMFFYVYIDQEGKPDLESDYYLATIHPLEDIITESKEAIKKIHSLRARFDAGELDTL